jgi:hypothetical protein
MLKTITMKQIMSWGPCERSNPSQYAGENWQGNALKILNNPNIPENDKLWVVLRKECLSDKTLRLFAVFCAREAIQTSGLNDPRSLKAVDVAELHAHGRASDRELREARQAAADAAAWADAAADAAYAAADAAYAAAYAADAAVRKQARKDQVKQLIKLILEYEA